MKCVLGILLLLAAPAFAQTDEPARPKSPDVEWVKGLPSIVELKAADVLLKLVPAQPLPMGAEGRFLFGLTPGFDVKAGGGGLMLQPRAWDDSHPDPILAKAGRRKFAFVYGGGGAIDVPVEYSAGGKPNYRIPALLEVVAGDVTLCFIDANGNGWFDDLDVDKVAVGPSSDPAKLSFEKFTGEISAGGKRWLVSANPRAAGLWPLSAGVSKDYVRHVSEVNAVRRFGGIEPVGFAEELIALCEAHSKYCAKNGLTHYEDKNSALFTPGGEYAGRHSNVGGAADAKSFARELLCTLWHRNFYYDGNLTRISVGLADGYASSDVRSYGDWDRTPALAPFRGALDVPLGSENESPDPYPDQHLPGPFVSVLFPKDTKAVLKVGTIAPRGGQPLKCDWTDPANPPAKAKSRFPDNDGCIVLIPHLALKPDTIHDVKITATISGKDEVFSWSFRTKGVK
ncbi:MAG: CAP domain-containing protein [Planctomycetota bacterium]